MLIFRRDKTDSSVLFIDASQECTLGRIQNSLAPEHIDKIIDTYKARQTCPGYAYLASIEEITQRKFNLNIALYIEPLVATQTMDVKSIYQESVKLKEELACVAL